MRGISLFAITAVLALLVGGCTRARAKTSPEPAVLAVPAPPPRVVDVATPNPIEPSPGPFPTAAPNPPAATPPTPAAVAARPPAKPAPSEVEPKLAEVPEPAGRILRPAVTAADGEEEKRVRDVLIRAARELARVDYRRLTSGGRSQYDQSKRFSDQAEAAIKDGNLVFAQTLADKAATLASGLSGR